MNSCSHCALVAARSLTSLHNERLFCSRLPARPAPRPLFDLFVQALHPSVHVGEARQVHVLPGYLLRRPRVGGFGTISIGHQQSSAFSRTWPRASLEHWFLAFVQGLTMPHKVRTAPGVIATSMPHIHVVQALNSAGHLLGHRLELGEPGICSEGFTNLNSRTQALESTASVETGRQSQKAFGCSSRSSAQLSCKLQAALGRQAGERLLVIPLQM